MTLGLLTTRTEILSRLNNGYTLCLSTAKVGDVTAKTLNKVRGKLKADYEHYTPQVIEIWDGTLRAFLLDVLSGEHPHIAIQQGQERVVVVALKPIPS